MEQFMLKVQGKPFRCACECNVFHKDARGAYVCNACGACYVGELAREATGHE